MQMLAEKIKNKTNLIGADTQAALLQRSRKKKKALVLVRRCCRRSQKKKWAMTVRRRCCRARREKNK
jgi:hypothetical protein